MLLRIDNLYIIHLGAWILDILADQNFGIKVFNGNFELSGTSFSKQFLGHLLIHIHNKLNINLNYLKYFWKGVCKVFICNYP